MVRIDQATVKDVEQIVEIEKDTFSDAWSKGAILDTLAQKQAFILVAREGEDILAYSILYYVLDECEIARIAVRKDRKRKGIGKQLLGGLSAYCKMLGVHKILLDVREGNEGARSFYADCGFQIDGIRKQFYDHPREDAVLMSKILG